MRFAPEESETSLAESPPPAQPLIFRASRRSARPDPTKVLTIALCSAVGLSLLAVADEASRRGYRYAPVSVLFWLGLLLIFVPIALRTLASEVDRQERLALIIVLGVACYVGKILASPHGFTFVDEYTHLRDTQDILRTHHLFASNPLLPTASYYPGLAALTAGLVDLTNLSTFVAGLVIIGVARVLFCACLYLVAERVTGSGQAAAGASLVYAANPMFLFWSAAFSYENLALPLAAFVVWWIGRTRKRGDLPSMALAAVGIVAVVVTHHVAGFALAALLGAWWIVELVRRQPARAARRRLGFMALLAGCVALAWFFVLAKPAPQYLLWNNLVPALRQTGSLIFGDLPPRRLYASGGLVPPAWEPVAGFLAIAVLVVALPAALRRSWRSRRRVPMAIATIFAVAFPLSLVPRLAPNGVALSGRSSEYLYTGLGCVYGLLVTEATSRRHDRGLYRFSPVARLRRLLSPLARHRTLAFTVLASVVFIGNVTIGTAFYERLPEATHPHGYPWSVQPDVFTASSWARTHLGIDQRFGASEIDSRALATYGDQDTLEEKQVWPIFFARLMTREVAQTIRNTRVHYLMIDWRMTRGVPATPGYYFSPEEPGAGKYRDVFPSAGLQKFSSSPCARLIYNSGPIQIFDVSGIESGVCGSLPSGPARAGEAP
jgi:hypothetical protein